MTKKYLALLLAIVALGAGLRFWHIADTPPGLYPDEAMNGNNVLEALSMHPFGAGFHVFYPENNGREGLFINIQALSVAAFGATPWALRIVSALMGTLAIVAIYFAAREIFASSAAGLFAAFFLATSYWHINFSRIGFRAIMLPLMATCGIYFLIRGMRRGKPYDLILAGIFTGLGVYTYIAFRFMVFVFAVPVVAALARWRAARRSPATSGTTTPCTPCNIAMYTLIAAVILIPLGLYFARHPGEFANRAGEVSIFGAVSPAKELAISSAKTVGMLFWRGDCNWRHNLPCQPELHPLVALFFLIGIAFLVWKWRRYRFEFSLLAVWLGAMALPVVLTREGVPHALRAIGMIPPIMLISALGAVKTFEGIGAWTSREKVRWPDHIHQLDRIRRELFILIAALLVIIPLAAYRDYFLVWAGAPETYDAFATSDVHLGTYLGSLPSDVKKYVIVNRDGILAGGVPIPAQTVMFMTDTFRPESRAEKNLSYVIASADPDHTVSSILLVTGEKSVVTLLDGHDMQLIQALKHRFPGLKPRAPSDFIVFEKF